MLRTKLEYFTNQGSNKLFDVEKLVHESKLGSKRVQLCFPFKLRGTHKTRIPFPSEQRQICKSQKDPLVSYVEICK